MLPLLVLALPGAALLLVLIGAYLLWGARGHRVYVVIYRSGRPRLVRV